MRAHAFKKTQGLLSDCRGASMTEYALLLALILIIAAGSFAVLGKKVRQSGDKAIGSF